MYDHDGTDYYTMILDGIGDETIARYDREESGWQYSREKRGGIWEYEQGFTFSELCRADQAAILRAIDTNLPTRNKRVNTSAGNSYGLKHSIERYLGFYVSNLQAKVAFRILGYQRGGDDYNPSYNISKRERRIFDDLSHDLDDRRSEARQRMARDREKKACARFFSKMAS